MKKPPLLCGAEQCAKCAKHAIFEGLCYRHVRELLGHQKDSTYESAPVGSISWQRCIHCKRIYDSDLDQLSLCGERRANHPAAKA